MCIYIGSSSDASKQPEVNIAKQLSFNQIALTQATICEKLKNARKNWYELGLVLGLEGAELDDIEDRYPDNKRRLSKMVSKRLEITDPKHPVTWPYICECLRNRLVERNDVANEIESLGLCG